MSLVFILTETSGFGIGVARTKVGEKVNQQKLLLSDSVIRRDLTKLGFCWKRESLFFGGLSKSKYSKIPRDFKNLYFSSSCKRLVFE